MRAKLEVAVGRQCGQVFDLRRGCNITFGRDSGCQVQLLDEGISRRHFAIRDAGNSFLIEDLHSSNGTFVSGNRIHAKILRSGDTLNVGAAKLVFHYVDAKHGYARLGTDIQSTVQFVDTGGEDSAGTVVLPFDRKQRAVDNILKCVQTGTDAKAGTDQLHTLFAVGNLLAEDLDLPTVLTQTLDTILEAVPADRGYIVLCEPDDLERYEMVIVRTPEERGVVTSGRKRRETLRLSRTVLNRVIREGASVLAGDARADQQLKASQSVLLQDIASVLAVPLVCRGRVLGAIYLDRQGAGGQGKYAQQDLQFLTAIGQQGGIAIENARRHEHMELLFYSCVKTLVSTIEAKDIYTHGHSERVTSVSMMIAEAMGFEGKDLDNLRLGALLHDIGKIGVPEKILRKPARLTPEEFDIMKSHPAQGGDIVENIVFLPRDSIDAVRYHHEKWNGSGYPEGLTGADIPIFARVVAVADAFDAMTSSRNYRRNFERDEVVAEFERCAGSHFDRNIVDVFVERLRKGEVLPSFQMYEQTLNAAVSPSSRYKAQQL